jgi:hypothetical protein
MAVKRMPKLFVIKEAGCEQGSILTSLQITE